MYSIIIWLLLDPDWLFKDLIGQSDVLYCDACSEQSLCTVNMNSLYKRQKKHLFDTMFSRVVFSLILASVIGGRERSFLN